MDILLKTVKLSNGETIGYRERIGSGTEKLLLIHGNMTSSKHWDVVLETFPEQYTTYAIDLRGFGLSSYKNQINSIKDFSEDLKLFVDVIGLDQFSICGWSTGGAVGMQFTADYPEYVNKLVLLASASTRGYPFITLNGNGDYVRLNTKEEISQDQIKAIPVTAAYKSGDTEFLRQVWNSLIYTTNQPEEKNYLEYLDDMLTQRNLIDVYYALNHFNISNKHNGISEGTGQAGDIAVPTLVLWGENDLVVTERMTKEIVEDLGETTEVSYLLGCGHSPLIDDLAQFNSKIINFLKK